MHDGPRSASDCTGACAQVAVSIGNLPSIGTVRREAGVNPNRDRRRPGPAARLLVAAGLLAVALGTSAGPVLAVAQDAAATPRTGPQDVILSTTTSTQDSGLLDVLVPLFEEQTGYNLKPIAVGSGAALKLGAEGEADIVLAHSPQAEAKFMAAGFGIERRTVMYNDFVVVGPPDDPTRAASAETAAEALTRIADAEATFVSRGDESGTHALERRLWQQAGIEPAGGWYVESGTGMGDTLNIASERRAYTIADRGTYFALRDRLDLDVLLEGDPSLINVYHVLLVNPANGRDINAAGGRAFVDFLLDPATQAVIGQYGVDRFGQPLFTPCADNSCGIEAAATPAATPAP